MKKLLTVTAFLVLVLVFSFGASSCTGVGTGVGGITASLGQEFTLPVGEKVSIEGEELTIKFVEVLGDSRCPAGVQCIQAGEAQCQLRFTYVGSPADMTIVHPGGGDVSATDYFIMYKIVFKLQPYPQAGQQIAASDYKLVMTVTK